MENTYLKKIKRLIRLKEFRRVIFIFILLLFVAFAFGFSAGSAVTIKAVAEVASGFIDIDTNAVRDALYQYKNNLGGCYKPLIPYEIQNKT